MPNSLSKQRSALKTIDISCFVKKIFLQKNFEIKSLQLLNVKKQKNHKNKNKSIKTKKKPKKLEIENGGTYQADE